MTRLASLDNSLRVTLSEWIDSKGRGEVSRLTRVTGLAYTTIMYARDGRKRVGYETAKAISDATGGKVSIADICESAVRTEAAE